MRSDAGKKSIIKAMKTKNGIRYKENDLLQGSFTECYQRNLLNVLYIYY